MDMPMSRTMPGLLNEIAAARPDAPFLTDGDHTMSYAQFRAHSREVARGLHRLGVRQGDKVAVLMGNREEWLLAAFAVTALGATLVALNTWWRAQELQHALALSDTSMLIMEGQYLKRDFTAELASLGDLKAALPLLRIIVAVGENPPPGAVAWPEVLAEDGPDDAVLDAAEAAVLAEDMAYLLFTSGSTARSKAVPLLHYGLVGNMHGIGERMHLTPDDRLLMTISMFWSFACANAMFAVLTHGGSIVLQYRFDPGEALELMEKERISVLYTMPNMVLALHNHPDRAGRDLGSLRTGLGWPHSLPMLEEMGGREMTTCYGLTEGYGNSAVADCRVPLAERRTSCGTALPGTTLQVVDPKTHAVLPAGEIGEVRIRGYVTPGYYNDPVKTEEAIDTEGWFYTGDLATLDAGGNLYFRGRNKEMVKTGGINVAPAEVEELLQAHPAVRFAAVVGIPDAERDEVLAAMVVLNPDGQATPAELARYCKDNAASYKVPQVIEVVDNGEVPLTDTGKVSKRLIQEHFGRAAGISRSPAG